MSMPVNDYRIDRDRLNEGIQVDQLLFELAGVQCQFTVLDLTSSIF